MVLSWWSFLAKCMQAPDRLCDLGKSWLARAKNLSGENMSRKGHMALKDELLDGNLLFQLQLGQD